MASSTNDPILVCRDLRKRYGERQAVDGVGFQIAAGETYGLLGPNGAGKTTSISMICGLLRRDGGEVLVAGRPVDIGATDAKAAIGYVPQDLAIYPDLTARENLRFFGQLQRLRGKELDRRVDEVLAVIDLADRAGERTDAFSGGMKRRLNIGIGLLHRPRLLVLDEPTVGVDPQSRNAILSSVAALESEGMAILYTTHYMEEAERLCDRIGIIDEGRIRAEGTRRELVALVGEKDRIELTAGGTVGPAMAALRALDVVEDATAADGRIELVVQDARNRLPKILEVAAAAGATVRSVEVVEPDLEAVFLHLTGKALRGLKADPDMRAALVIAAKDLRQKLRDRSVLLMAVAAPLGLAFLFSTMIPDQDTFHATYAVVDLDGGDVARGLVDGPLAGLETAGVATLVTKASEAEARTAVEAGDVSAAIVIPAGFSDAVKAGSQVSLLVVGGSSTLPAEIARSVLGSFGSQVTAVQVAVATTITVSGASPDPALAAELAQAAVTAPEPIEVSEGETVDRAASTKTFYGASMAVMFVFFAAQFGVLGLLAERRNGTLARMLAAPIAPATILVGKVLVSLVVACISMTVVVVGTTLLLGADWGDPLAVAALILAVSIAATGIATLVVGFARTEEQAGGFIAIVALVLAVFGGSFFRMSQAPEGMAALSIVTPHAWFLRGIDDLAGGGGVAVVAPSLGVLVAIGVVTGGLGLLRARRVVAP